MSDSKTIQTKNKHIKWSKVIFICVMMLYPLLQLLLFWIMPNFSSIVSAFLKRNKLTGIEYFSFANFSKLFGELAKADSHLAISLKNSFWYFLTTVVIGIPLTVILSYFIYKKIFGYKVFRVVFFMPSIIAGVVLATLFITFVEYPVSPFSMLMAKILNCDINSTPNLLKNFKVPTICIYTLWTGFGVNLVMFNTAMQRLPSDVIEYGKIEGVGMTRELVQIIIPMIFPTLTTVLVLGMASYFTFIQPVMLFMPLPKGDQTGKSWSLAYYIYYMFKGKEVPDVNYACTIGVFFALIGTPLIIGIKALLDKAVSAVEY